MSFLSLGFYGGGDVLGIMLIKRKNKMYSSLLARNVNSIAADAALVSRQWLAASCYGEVGLCC